MKRLCLALLCCVALTTPLSAGEDGIKQTIAYVQSLQTAPGGFRTYDPKKNTVLVLPTLRSTSSAVRALHYLGGDLFNKNACIMFVDSCYDPETGGFSDTPKAKPDIFSTAVGLMAVAELKMPPEKYADGASKYLSENAKTFEDIRIAAAGFEAIKKKGPKADQWSAEVSKLQNKDGTYGKELGMARDTASSVVTLLRFGAKPSNLDDCLKVLKDGQRQNGGWGKADSEIASDLETTYRVMRCFVMLKAKPGNVEGVRSFVAKCRNADGGYGIASGQPSSVNGTYFAAIITHWLKQ
jgi:hypothetical protein